jgi:hypothetical protein
VIRPFTCVCLILAAGSGLYLYQVKQRAFALDASLRGTFHDIDVARERTRMLRADWALVNDPERLQVLASQYLTLQPMQPSQLLTMDQLAAALPPVPPSATPASVATPPAAAKPAPAVDPTQGLPMAEAAPQVLPHTHPVAPEVALLQPPASLPAAPQQAAPQPAAPQPAAPQPASLVVPEPPDVATPAPLPRTIRHTIPHRSHSRGWQARTETRRRRGGMPSITPRLRQHRRGNSTPPTFRRTRWTRRPGSRRQPRP